MKNLLCVLLFLPVFVYAFYEAILFGDVHFDSQDVRDANLKRPEYQEREMKRNMKLWANDIPGMIERAAKMAGNNTVFAVQLGDICQGDCGSQELHEKSLNMVLEKFRTAFPGTRLLVVPGNHDIRGKGAAEAYKAVMIPYLSQILNEKLSQENPVQYSMMVENDLFIFMDCNNPDFDFLQKTIESHPEHRHLFVITHFPVLFVSQGRPLWTLFHKQPERREQLFALLAKHKAIVLCAHVHISTLTRWKGDDGSFTQVSLFSMLNSNKAKAIGITEHNMNNPFPKFTEAKDTKQEDKELLAKYLSGYTEFKDITPSAGFSILKVNEGEVTIEMYNTVDAKPSQLLLLTNGD